MKHETCSPLEHLAGVIAVVGLSMIIHIGMHTGSGLFGPQQTLATLAGGPDPAIAAPASAQWGQAVMRLNGMQ